MCQSFSVPSPHLLLPSAELSAVCSGFQLFQYCVLYALNFITRQRLINTFCHFLPSLTTLVQIVINKSKTPASSVNPAQHSGYGYEGCTGCTNAHLRVKEQLFAALHFPLGESTDEEAGCKNTGGLPGDFGLL